MQSRLKCIGALHQIIMSKVPITYVALLCNQRGAANRTNTSTTETRRYITNIPALIGQFIQSIYQHYASTYLTNECAISIQTNTKIRYNHFEINYRPIAEVESSLLEAGIYV